MQGLHHQALLTFLTSFVTWHFTVQIPWKSLDSELVSCLYHVPSVKLFPVLRLTSLKHNAVLNRWSPLVDLRAPLASNTSAPCSSNLRTVDSEASPPFVSSWQVEKERKHWHRFLTTIMFYIFLYIIYRTYQKSLT